MDGDGEVATEQDVNGHVGVHPRPRWGDALAIASIWLLGGIIAQAPIVPAVTAATIAGCTTLLLLLRPLRASEREVRNTATARRITLTVGAMAVTTFVPAILAVWRPNLPTVIAIAVISWAHLAVSTRVHPLAVESATVPNGLGATDGHLTPVRLSPLQRVGKRAFDLIGATALGIVALPVLAVAAAAIKVDDGGPVLFRQRRRGRAGTSFPMFKFRSMVLDAEARKAEMLALNQRSGPLFKLTDDPRITPVGRVIRELSIDELPQLLNILRGEMSLVGPRPAIPDEAADFDARLAGRDLLTPGLTGLWQAEARSDADFERFRSLDLRYLHTRSPLLDLWILLATVTEVLTAAAAVPMRRLGLDVERVDGLVIDVRDTAPGATVIDLRTHRTSTRDEPHGGGYQSA